MRTRSTLASLLVATVAVASTFTLLAGCGNTTPTGPGACSVDSDCKLPNAVAACVTQVCAVATCTPNYANCDGDATTLNGCEVYLLDDAQNCGTCGTQCASNEACVAGKCVMPAPDAGCPATCALPNATDSMCMNVTCVVSTCDTGFGNCNLIQADGCEINLTNTADNCGKCGTVCSTNNTSVVACAASKCTGTCLAGFGDCNANIGADGCEADLSSDGNNCGACGVVCTGNLVCLDGLCLGPVDAKPTAGSDGGVGSPDLTMPIAGSVDLGTSDAAPAVTDGGVDAAPSDSAITADLTGTTSPGQPDLIVCTTGLACDVVDNCASIGATCVQGACVANNCQALVTADCDHCIQNGCETTIASDPLNCGACNVACGAGASCISGACVTMVLPLDASTPADMSVPVDAATQEDLAMATQPDLSVAAQPDLSVVAQPDLTVSAQPDLTVSAQPDLTVAAQPDLRTAPQPDMSVLPDLAKSPDLSEKPDLESSFGPDLTSGLDL